MFGVPSPVAPQRPQSRPMAAQPAPATGHEVFQQTRFGTGPVPAQSGPAPTPVPPARQAPDSGAMTAGMSAARSVDQASIGGNTTNTRGQGPDSELQPPAGVVAAGIGLEAGARVDQYELIRELGRGGMGMVWAARDTKLGRRVAIKFLLDASRAVADRFLAEAQATALFNHENIVIIHGVGETAGMPYMVLEFLEGQPLRGHMGAYQSGAQMAASRVVELSLPVARALARAHEAGMVHRDLKPENVFVTNTGTVKVLDFGIAKAVSNRQAPQGRTQYGDLRSATPMNMTREGALVGTLPYMSPEQMGVGEVDHRSDIWALGIMMFEMLAGKHPVDPLTTEALITNAISEDPMMSIRDVVPSVPDGLAQIIDGCLRKRIVERIGSANDIVKSLEELLPGRAGRQLAEGESPYPGLTAFQENDANRFFGRARDITRMVAKVRELPITGIVGPSGVGKSSFIRAGVGPALKVSGERWDVVTLRPGRQPLAALASVVQKLTTRSGADVQSQVNEHNQLMHRLRTEPGYIGTLLRGRARQSNGHILLFVDQFEELYTLVPDPAERRAFTAALAGVADDTAAPLRVVVSMRSDFLDRVAEDPHFMEELSRGLVFLQPPDRIGLREALVSPVEMVSHRFESERMVEDMLSALDGTSGALPLLQFAAAKLWDARDRQRRLLTESSYQAIGGIQGALATHADDVVAQMNERMQKLTQKLFRRLVTPERTRAIVELADLYQLGDQVEVSRLLDSLVGARLLVVQTRADAGGGTAEIVHESLIERWPTLRRWLDEDQEDAAFVAQLAAAAKQWEAKGRATGLLWRGEAMEEARRWYNQRTRELPPREKAFLDAVFALARRGTRIKRFVLGSAFVVLGGVAAGAMVMMLQIRSAEQEARSNLVKAEKAEQAAKNNEQAAKDGEAKAKQALEDVMRAQNAQAAAEAEAKKKADEAAAEAVKNAQLASANEEAGKTIEEQNKALKEKAAILEKALADANRAKKQAQDAQKAAEAEKRRAEANEKAALEKAARAKGMVKAGDLK
jgi:serine/threonine protein kinase